MPKLYIAIIGGLILVRIVDEALISLFSTSVHPTVAKEWGQMFFSACSYGLWVLYFTKSTRVRNTFIRWLSVTKADPDPTIEVLQSTSSR